MAKAEDVKVLNIDGVPYAVDAMSDNVKRLVSFFNDWNQKELDLTSDLLMVQSAKSHLSQQIIFQVRNEKQKAEEAATAPAAVNPTPPGVEESAV